MRCGGRRNGDRNIGNLTKYSEHSIFVPPKRAGAITVDGNRNANESMPKGRVKWFDSKKGYGFIASEEGKDLFVHYTAIKSDKKFKSLEEGTNVEFDIVEGKKGLQAVNVVIVTQ